MNSNSGAPRMFEFCSSSLQLPATVDEELAHAMFEFCPTSYRHTSLSPTSKVGIGRGVGENSNIEHSPIRGEQMFEFSFSRPPAPRLRAPSAVTDASLARRR